MAKLLTFVPPATPPPARTPFGDRGVLLFNGVPRHDWAYCLVKQAMEESLNHRATPTLGPPSSNGVAPEPVAEPDAAEKTEARISLAPPPTLTKPAAPPNVLLVHPEPVHPMHRVATILWRCLKAMRHLDAAFVGYEALVGLVTAPLLFATGYTCGGLAMAGVGGLFCWFAVDRVRALRAPPEPEENDSEWVALHYRARSATTMWAHNSNLSEPTT